MKKPLSKSAQTREASFWENIKAIIRENPGKLCHK
jgi:hypothetical protein